MKNKKSKEVWVIQEPGRGRQGPGTRLDFLLDLRSRGRMWTQDEAMYFVSKLKKGVTLEDCAKDVNCMKSYRGKNKLWAVRNRFTELRRAARKGYTLQRYFREGCPLRAGARVLVEK